MSLHLKKTSIALAVAAASGVTFAAPVTTTTLTAATPTVTSVAGDITLNVNPAPNNDSQKSVTTTVGEGFQSIVDNTANNTADATKNQATYVKTTNKNSSATGVVTEKQNYKTAGKATVNAGGQVTGFAADPATKTADGAVAQTFAADDVTKKQDANTQSFEATHEDVTYVAADEKDTTHTYSEKSSNLTTKKKLGADGKQVGDQTIRTGTVAFEDSNSNVVYKNEIKNGKLTSKNANGILDSTDTNDSNHTVTEAYQTNAAGDVIATKLSADKKFLLGQSSVNTSKSAGTTKTVNYDEVSAKQQTYDETQSWENTQEYLDGYVGGTKGTSEEHNTKYNQAALGTSNALDYSNSDKSSSEIKYRTFAKTKNAAGEDIYATTADGKLIVDTETETKTTNETYDSVYQPTRYTADDAARGIAKGDAYNEHILNTGVPTEWDWRSTDVQKSTLKATESKVVTHKQDGDFKEHWNKATDNSTVYARNHQENIEVDRDISQSYSEDERTLNKAYKVGETVVTAGEDEQFALGTVRVNDQGRVLTADDVKTWKDETGKERYYVEIGTDAEGHQIRSEVTFKNGKPEVKKDVLVDVVDTKVFDKKRTDKVTMGEEVAYNTKTSIKNESATTSRDGSIVYESEKSNVTTDTNVYSIGKNALDYQNVVEGSNATVKSDYKLDANNKVVVTAVNSTNDTWKNTTQQFQPGQEKQSVQSNAGTWNDTKTVDGIEVAYDRGTDEKTTTQYNTGKNELDRTIVSKETGETKDQGLVTISTNIRPVNENGNKITAGGVLAVDENGEDVVSKATNTVATVKTDTVTKTTNNVDEKVYQTGVTAYSKVESNSSDAVITYSDNTAGYAKSANNSDVKLYNHGESDKYRDFTSLNTSSSKENQYALDDAGKAVLAYTEEKSNSTANTEVDYQAGKNALDNSRNTVVKNTNTKTSADKTVATKDATTTDVLTYQKGQELNTSTKEVSETEKTTTTAAATEAITDKTTTDILVYQEGHELDNTFTEVSAGQEKMTKADGTGYTYTTSGKKDDKVYSSRMGLLASGDVKSVEKLEWTESLAASGKNAVSITRGDEFVKRTDESHTYTVYGSETVTAATGTTTVAKKEVDVTDKFGTFESSTLSRTETKVAADKSSTVNTKTRAESVDGVVLTSTQTNTDAAGKAVTSTRTTSLNSTTGLTTDQITLNGKDLQTELNRMGNNIDDVQRTAYRGIAIALAAQQAVPNIAPGQVAVFGGVGHYEGETAGSIGVVTSFTDRISASGAFGFAGGSEFGGRVGVAYVFGGK
ncbi:YadA C-terminal domain-containing protein [Acinetobacter junii]|uniref:YadA C-terminal domain-containing protein n=1 Tax=Acinetobacter junii TaxID=40215 RepID=UPI0035FC6B91